MDYFRTLSVVLGTLMVLGGLWISLCPKQARAWVEKLYPEIRPRWVLTAGAAILVLTVWTWVQFFIRTSMYAFAVTLVVSLTMTKIVLAVLFYKKFREITMALMGELLALRVVMMSSAAIGTALLILGLFL